jgi:hypothetical protein
MKETFLQELARAWLRREEGPLRGLRILGYGLAIGGLAPAFLSIIKFSLPGFVLSAAIGILGLGLLVVPSWLANNRRRFCQRFARRRQVDPEVVERCLDLLETERWPEPLGEHIRAALNAYAGICEVSHQPMWAEHGLSLEDYLDSVKQAILIFLGHAQNAEKIGRLVQRYADRMRDPEAQSLVQARFARRNEELGRMAQGFERTLARLMEAYVAAHDETVSAADVAASLREFGEAMATLTEGFDAVEEALSDLEEEPEPPPRLAEGVSEATALVQELQDMRDT